MPIGRLHHTIVDCPDPHRLAEFYARLLDLPVTYADDDFAVVSRDDRTSGLAFQRSPDQRPPTWPDPAVPQQIHLDVMVEDVAAATPRVLALGATKLAGDDVFAEVGSKHLGSADLRKVFPGHEASAAKFRGLLG